MIYAYIFVMAGVTYLIRMLPLTLVQKKITNVYVRSFLYYIPYACLTAMTFPAVLYAASSPIAYHGCIYGIKKEKLDCSSFVSLHCCVFGGKNCGVFVKKL